MNSRIILPALAALLGACGDSATPGTAAIDATPAVEPRHARGTVKPGASVAMQYTLPKAWAAGETNTIRFSFDAGARPGKMTVSVAERSGAALGGTRRFEFDLGGAEPLEALVAMTPAADGYYQLDVTMQVTDEAGGTRIRIDSVPITIGDAPALKPASSAEKGAGEVVLPALETYE